MRNLTNRSGKQVFNIKYPIEIVKYFSEDFLPLRHFICTYVLHSQRKNHRTFTPMCFHPASLWFMMPLRLSVQCNQTDGTGAGFLPFFQIFQSHIRFGLTTPHLFNLPTRADSFPSSMIINDFKLANASSSPLETGQ